MPRCRSHVAPALALAVAALAGCYYPGGPGASWDQHTYESTSWAPYTITLVDPRTDEVLWSTDVPVGKELVVQFFADRGIAGSNTPDQMKWAIFPIGQRFGDLPNSVAVPPSYGRKLDMKLRPVPELPEDMSASPAPLKQPVIAPEAGKQPPK